MSLLLLMFLLLPGSEDAAYLFSHILDLEIRQQCVFFTQCQFPVPRISWSTLKQVQESQFRGDHHISAVGVWDIRLKSVKVHLPKIPRL